MVNSPHEALHRAFRQFPELFGRAFALLGLPEPGATVVSDVNCDLTEVRPIERRVDTLLRLDGPDGRGYLLAVESQTADDPEKARSWAYYLAYLANRYRDHRPVLLVLCRDRATARWAAGPFRIGHPAGANLQLTPFVLGPDNVPFITDVEQAAADLPLTLFSALTHSSDPRIGEILDVLAAALKKTEDDDAVTVYADFTASGLADSPTAADHWRKLMSSGLFELRGFVAEGLRDEGRLQTQIEQLLQLLDARNIPLTQTQHHHLTTCHDTHLLSHWFTQALTARAADEVLTSAPAEPGPASG
ncbi:hypothetical protein [Streptomyces xiaopingdaonensis]|uniref:hypothetical protein n=1 Tax=Streptomyces xiaopingdaonensis TaxID=1565415 RepID=UPI0002FB968D|nr:hypothetical protein [Streptomyces xiaopingdaonensis]